MTIEALYEAKNLTSRGNYIIMLSVIVCLIKSIGGKGVIGSMARLDSKTFGKLVRMALEYAEMSPRDLAEELKKRGHTSRKGKPLTVQTINGWLRGELKNPTLSLADDIADCVNQPPEVLYGVANFRLKHLEIKEGTPRNFRRPALALRDSTEPDLKSVGRVGRAGSSPAPGTPVPNCDPAPDYLAIEPSPLYNLTFCTCPG